VKLLFGGARSIDDLRDRPERVRLTAHCGLRMDHSVDGCRSIKEELSVEVGTFYLGHSVEEGIQRECLPPSRLSVVSFTAMPYFQGRETS
jgi:hypothetical protein